MLGLLVDILDWRGKRKARKEGRKYGITIGQHYDNNRLFGYNSAGPACVYLPGKLMALNSQTGRFDRHRCSGMMALHTSVLGILATNEDEWEWDNL